MDNFRIKVAEILKLPQKNVVVDSLKLYDTKQLKEEIESRTNHDKEQ